MALPTGPLWPGCAGPQEKADTVLRAIWPAQHRSLASGSPRASAWACVGSVGSCGSSPQGQEPRRKSRGPHWVYLAIQRRQGRRWQVALWDRFEVGGWVGILFLTARKVPTGCMQWQVLRMETGRGHWTPALCPPHCLPACQPIHQVPGPTGQGLAARESWAPQGGEEKPQV